MILSAQSGVRRIIRPDPQTVDARDGDTRKFRIWFDRFETRELN